MRRWLLALFALQFFCSVSAFTFAHPEPLEPSTHAAGGVVEASEGALDIALKGAASAFDPTHGLMDDIPELPECLDVVIAQSTVATPWDVPRDHLVAEWTPPALDGPQRPPRVLLALV